MQFKATERVNGKLTRDGYMYILQKMLANDVSSCECILRRKGAQCKASIKLSILDEFIGQNSEHTHHPSQTQVEVTKGKASIKWKAEATGEKSQQTLAPELRNSKMGLLLIFLISMRLKERSAMHVRVREDHATQSSGS